jgi:membrane protease YdiL (CAAX protease family)
MRSSDRSPPRADHPVREVVAVFAGVTLATVALSRAGSLPWFADYVHLSVGVLFLWTALHMSQRQPNGTERYGLALGGVLDPPQDAPPGLLGGVLDLARALWRAAPSAAREAGVALALAAVIFPPFVVGFYLWHGPQRAFVFHLPDDLASYALAQLLVIALPEEALFRGYLMGRLGDAFPGRVRLLRASLSVPAWLGSSVLFALIHFAVDLNVIRLAVFFPALAFGWLTALRGGIGAAVVFHALSNLLSDVLVRGWL